MFLFFSKITAVLITPGYWILALIIWFVLTKSATVKKRLSIVIILLIFFFGNGYVYSRLVLAWQPKLVTLAGRNYDIGILLGGIGSFDNYGTGYLNEASDRFTEACVLYKTGKIRKILISAGNLDRKKPKEADFLAKKMIELGIPAKDILIENNSRTTFENARFTKAKLDSLQFKPPYILITSAMHVPRAKSVFEKAGMEVIPFPTHFSVIERKVRVLDFIPNVGTIDAWSGFLKEVVGLWGYKLFRKA
jgi:uncharacterized SAM-binding protein YcdF (DUF218 family)